MRQNPDVAPRVRHGVWYPPRPLSSNELVAGDTTGLFFYFDGNRVTEVQGLPTEGQVPILFQELSAYFYDNNFWCVPYNAVTNQVGTGRQDDEDDDDDADAEDEDEETYTPHWVDWHQMRFNHDTNHWISLANVPGEHDELITQRDDQRWVPELLPDKYHADRDRWTSYPYGGMNGRLSLLLALLAFSVPPDYVQRVVEHCVRGDYWRHSGYRHRGRGCMYL